MVNGHDSLIGINSVIDPTSRICIKTRVSMFRTLITTLNTSLRSHGRITVLQPCTKQVKGHRVVETWRIQDPVCTMSNAQYHVLVPCSAPDCSQAVSSHVTTMQKPQHCLQPCKSPSKATRHLSAAWLLVPYAENDGKHHAIKCQIRGTTNSHSQGLNRDMSGKQLLRLDGRRSKTHLLASFSQVESVHN